MHKKKMSVLEKSETVSHCMSFKDRVYIYLVLYSESLIVDFRYEGARVWVQTSAILSSTPAALHIQTAFW